MGSLFVCHPRYYVYSQVPGCGSARSFNPVVPSRALRVIAGSSRAFGRVVGSREYLLEFLSLE
jgi:hypothetical protein